MQLEHTNQPGCPACKVARELSFQVLELCEQQARAAAAGQPHLDVVDTAHAIMMAIGALIVSSEAPNIPAGASERLIQSLAAQAIELARQSTGAVRDGRTGKASGRPRIGFADLTLPDDGKVH